MFRATILLALYAAAAAAQNARTEGPPWQEGVAMRVDTVTLRHEHPCPPPTNRRRRRHRRLIKLLPSAVTAINTVTTTW